jgi:hypothetical protein
MLNCQTFSVENAAEMTNDFTHKDQRPQRERPENPLTRRVGRPPRETLLPEHAEVVRRAVKAGARYYGIRLRDLGESGAWMADVMRSRAPMPVETAKRLMREIVSPNPDLIGKKRPQGMHLEDLGRLMMGNELKPWIIKDDAAGQFFGYLAYAGLMLQPYAIPVGGTAFFVMPGASKRVAAELMARLPLGRIGRVKRKSLQDTIVEFLEPGEVALRKEENKYLIPRLTYLGIVNSLGIAADIGPLPNEEEKVEAAFAEYELADKARAEATRRNSEQ